MMIGDLGETFVSLIRLHFLSRYFDDPWQNLPKDGYTTMFENMLLKDSKITVRLNMDYFE